MRSQMLAALLLAVTSSAEVITQWDFNSAEADETAATGRMEPAQGEGVLTVLEANAGFGSVAGGSPSDGNTGDNSQLRLSGFPGQGKGSKSAGLEVRVSTAGYRSIKVAWDHENSGTASRYWRVQYTLDGTQWVDHDVLENGTAGSWLAGRTVSFGAVPEAEDNPNFGVRIVSEFELGATGNGAEGYRPVNSTGNYSTAGTWWVDMVTISGDVMGGGNSPPGISGIADLEMMAGGVAGPIRFVISDIESGAEGLGLRHEVSQPGMIARVEWGGEGSARTILLTAAPGAEGRCAVTVFVSDGQLESGTRFEVMIRPAVVLARWDFNSVEPDGDPATGAAAGLEVFGGVKASFGSVAGGATSDPVKADNSMLRLAGFPARLAGNKTAGVGFQASTGGYGDLTLWWDHYNSNTGSRYWRVQYSTNGEDFVDHVVFTNLTASKWHLGNVVRFTGVAAVENNPRFAFRWVAEFESTVAEGGEDGYRAVNEGSSYSGAGTLWMDQVVLLGRALPRDPAPRVTLEMEEVVLNHGESGRVGFTVEHGGQGGLEVRVESRDAWLVGKEGLVIEGSGEARQLVIWPAAGVFGEGWVVLVVSDGVREARAELRVRVLPPVVELPPRLRVHWNGGEGWLAWPLAPEGYGLEGKEVLGEGDWAPVEGAEQAIEEWRVAVPGSGRARFYRLRKGGSQ